jgi:predicted negative regulator of RcsB-dependent stress response
MTGFNRLLSPIFLAVSALLGLILCCIPLLNILGYESAAAAGAVLGLCSMFYTAHCISSSKIEAPIAWERVRPPTADFLGLLATNCCMAVPPFILLCINALRVRNCDPLTGLLFWLLLPPVSILIGSAAGWLAGALSTRYAPWFAGAIGAAEIGLFLKRLAMEPPIMGFEWFIGWFAGSLYDEALSIPSTLIWYRVWVLAQAILIVGGVEFLWRRRHARSTMAAFWAVCFSASAVVSIYAIRTDIGMMHSHTSVRRELGGHASTEHFEIYYSPLAMQKEKLESFKMDAEFRYWQLEAFFGEDPVAHRKKAIEIYLYPDEGEQSRLMGSRNTMVARPWTHQMHLRWRTLGDNALTHELAHLFTSPFAGSFMDIPLRWGIFVDIGLMEGIAAAAEWKPSELNLHQVSAALRRMGKAPDLRRLFSSTGFWAQPSGKAYRMTGSFVRWLVEEQGISAFKELYATGDFMDAYGREADDLISEWEQYVDAIELSKRQMELARYRYDRKSIFQKVCARSLAEKERKLAEEQRAGRLDQARQQLDELIRLTPSRKGYRLLLADILMDQNRAEEALDVAVGLLAEDLDQSLTAAANERKGDALWMLGRREAAGASYTDCQGLGISDATARRLLVKIDGLSDDIESIARGFFMEDDSTSLQIHSLHMWQEKRPEDTLPRYLLGLQLAGLLRHTTAAELLGSGILDEAELDEQRRLMLLKSLLSSGKTDGVETLLSQLGKTESTRVRMERQEAELRYRWMRTEGGAQ